MPLFYAAAQRAVNTNATGNTESARISFLTGVAPKPIVYITGVFANIANSSVAGSAVFTGSTFQTAGAAGTGTALIPGKRASQQQAAVVTASTGTFTAGTGTRTIQITVGMAQTGGQGGWIAVTPDTGLQLANGGGTAGYAEFADLATTASQPLSYLIEFSEA